MAPTSTSGLDASVLGHLAAARRRGLALDEVLQVLAQDAERAPRSRQVMAALAADLAAGTALSAALLKLPDACAAATARWLQDAETESADAAALAAWGQDLRSQESARREHRMALAWPAVVAVCMLLLWVMVATFVLPAFAELWKEFGADLPEPTLWVLGLGTLGGRQPYVLPIVLLVLAGALWLLRHRWLPPARALAEQASFVRRVAVAQRVQRLLALARAHAGAPRLQAAALGHLAASAGSARWAGAVTRMQAALVAGQPLSAALLAEGELPRTLGLQVQLGERHGNLPEVLAQLQEDNELQGREHVARFERNTLLLVYAALAAGAFLLVSAIYLPIFKLGSFF